MTGSEPILSEVANGVAIITLNRPERRNAWTRTLETSYFHAVFEAAKNPDAKILLITGNPEGRAFCPGLDMQDLDAASHGEQLTRKRWPHSLLTKVPKPTIVAINGSCAGLGMVQAMYADIRFVQAGSKLTTAFARRGLPAEHGIAWIMERIAGHAVAADLMLSGRVFTAEEAYELGLVKAVLSAEALMPTALSYAEDIAANSSPAAMAQIKHQLYAGLEQDLESARQLALRNMYEDRSEVDFAEGVQSFVEKRPPSFPGLSFDLASTVRIDEDPD
jgi:enoyl-CoA hydratase/carnithine racemase